MLLLPQIKTYVACLLLYSCSVFLACSAAFFRIQDCVSGCSDNHVGCTRAGLYKRGNSGDTQTGGRGPSINLTGWRQAAKSLSAWFGAGSSVGVLLLVPVPPCVPWASGGPCQNTRTISISQSASGTTGRVCSTPAQISSARNP